MATGQPRSVLNVMAAARAWVRLYTLGLPATAKSERREEIDSDIFEHRREADRTGARFPLELLLRVVLGVPADLSWRAERARPGTWFAPLWRRAGLAGSWTVRRGLPGVSWLLAGSYLLIGGGMLVTLAFPHAKPASELVGGAVLLVVEGTLIFAALRLVGSRRWLGLALLAGGLLPLALVFLATVIVPLASVVVLAYGAVKSRSRPALAPS